MTVSINTDITFTANLYLDGLPVVLNQQCLQQRLRRPRLTKREQLDAEVSLADSRVASLLTLADHEHDEPLLLKFVAQDDRYAIHVVQRGEFDNARLTFENKTHNLLASTADKTDYFSINKLGASSTTFSDIESGAAYIGLGSESNNRPLYHRVVKGMSTFLNVNPNPSKHDAFNYSSAVFVIKVVEKLSAVT
ncbi:hypothetical protein [Pseudomonas sp. NPDC087615]|uniref:hypothetical protein n=1 Tax=Pseudomonas sp. NPDC087615 TaxID=3364443 RepID=UPI00382ADDF3